MRAARKLRRRRPIRMFGTAWHPPQRAVLIRHPSTSLRSQQALHWFEFAPFYAEVEPVLRPGGVLAVWTYGVVHVAGESIDRLLQEFYWQTVQPYWPAERRLVESGYRGLSFPYAELTPPAFDMQEHWSLQQLIGYVRSWSATARYVEQNRADPAALLEQSLQPGWGDPDSLRRISWPLSVRIGVKP